MTIKFIKIDIAKDEIGPVPEREKAKVNMANLSLNIVNYTSFLVKNIEHYLKFISTNIDNIKDLTFIVYTREFEEALQTLGIKNIIRFYDFSKKIKASSIQTQNVVSFIPHLYNLNVFAPNISEETTVFFLNDKNFVSVCKKMA